MKRKFLIPTLSTLSGLSKPTQAGMASASARVERN